MVDNTNLAMKDVSAAPQNVDISPVNKVIDDLRMLIRHSTLQHSRIGYFACLYLHVTTTFREGILNNEFEHPELMVHLDEVFAHRYLSALKDWENKEAVTESWLLSFDGTRKHSLIVTQQLLSAANAHINLDLGIAVATAVPLQSLPAFEADFNRINELLGSLLGMVKRELGNIWWPLRIVNKWFGWLESGLINLVMLEERERAWAFANALAKAPKDTWPQVIEARDKEVAKLGDMIVRPPTFARLGLLVIRVMEIRGIDNIIHVLEKMKPKRK